MSSAETVALVGFGAIGASVAHAISSKSLPGCSLVGVMTRSGRRDLPRDVPVVDDLECLIGLQPDVVIEAAGTEAFSHIVPVCLSNGLDVLALSVAAMAQPQVEDGVRTASHEGGGRLLIASGSIGCLDTLSAAREGGIDAVKVVQRKPVHALMDGAQAEALKQATVIMSSNAREAALAFPRNSNIAAAVALAGIGFDETRVDVIADPAETRNVVELEASGRFGEFRLVVRNLASPSNPRTAMIPAMSVLSSLRRKSAAVVVPS